MQSYANHVFMFSHQQGHLGEIQFENLYEAAGGFAATARYKSNYHERNKQWRDDDSRPKELAQTEHFVTQQHKNYLNPFQSMYS